MLVQDPEEWRDICEIWTLPIEDNKNFVCRLTAWPILCQLETKILAWTRIRDPDSNPGPSENFSLGITMKVIMVVSLRKNNQLNKTKDSCIRKQSLAEGSGKTPQWIECA